MKLHIFVLLLVSAVAQKKTPALTVEKKPLSQEVYDGWKEISYIGITPDGTTAAFLINPQEGDGKLLVTNLVNGKTDSVLRAAEVALTFDSRFVVFKIKPEKEKVKELRRQKKKKEDLPKDSLGIFTLANRSLQRVPDVRSYKVPEKAGGWLAYQIEAKKEEKKKEEKKPDSVVASAKPKKKARKNSDDNGYTLVLQNLSSQSSTQFGYVKDYLFAKRGTGLLFTTTGNDSTMTAGVYWYELPAQTLRQLHEGKAKYKYKGLAINEAGDQISFLLDSDTTKALQRHHELFHWKRGEDRASVLVHEGTNGIPTDWLISEYATPLFSKDGTILFAGSTPRSPLPDTTKLEEETVRVDIWNWRDSVLQSQQNKQLDSEKKRSYLFAMDLSSRTLRQLAGPTIPNILLGDEGNAEVALGLSDRPYRWSNFYDNSGHNDVYTVNVRTGARQLIRQKLKGNVAISPRAKYVYWFSLPDTNWFCYSMATGRTQPVTKGMAVPIVDEENDEPDYPRQYGVAGWLADDARMLIYDRYDIWQIDPENQTPPVNLTKTGREQRIRFRYLKLDPEERFIREGSTLLLAAFHEVTRMSGYYSLNLKTGELKQLLMSGHQYESTTKALQSERLLFTRESFTEFPDVWVSNTSLQMPRKITNANPQQRHYLWGTAELVNWTSLDNVPLEGLLYKPENFDPKKKYPMIVYFYDRSSDELFGYYKPQPSWSIIQRTMMVSNGYLVFIPDIRYKLGLPGESAYNCIMPGVTSLIKQGFVDEKNIGIQGQSWGGYQTAYIITRTNLFKAAGAGAAVVNMTSAYGGIRWGSGLSRMFQYEQGQSRIGATLWDKPLYYLENSPLFTANKIQTPVLIMQNDKDDAVPWFQGIEFYMALRRLHKPVWMLVYNDEVHNLQQRQNRKDYDKRLMQFFDFYLKGAPEPPWMKNGVPATEKSITTGY